MTTTSTSRNRKWITGLLIGFAFLGLLAYTLFKPFTSSRFNIAVDAKGIAEKKAFLSTATVGSVNGTKPNIIVLVADDLGKTDIPLYGNAELHTPFLDSLAAEGVKFTEGYVTAAICSPSRAGLLTGRYQQRFGHETQPVNRYMRNYFEQFLANTFIDKQGLEFANNTEVPALESVALQGLPLQEITLADVLRKNGYATGMVGKWHLGANEPFQPLNRGFDYHYGFYEAFAWYTDTTRRDIVNVRASGIMDSHVWDHGHQGNSLIRRQNKIIDEKEYLTDALAHEAVTFIDAQKSKPFFLYVPFNAPHTPFQAPREDVERLQAKGFSKKQATYYAMIEHLDNAVGAILQKVRSAGLEENTLIFFISDNGGATYTGATTNAPLKGGKLSLYEGGLNVPFVAKWKGQIPAGTVYTKPVISLDIFATAAAVSGAELPRNRTYDGVNLLPFVTAANSTSPHEALFWRAGFNKAVRKGDWKLVKNGKDNFTVLYNLSVDKEEAHDLSISHPEKVKELEEALSVWEKQLVQPLWPSNGFFVNKVDGREDRFTL